MYNFTVWLKHCIGLRTKRDINFNGLVARPEGRQFTYPQVYSAFTEFHNGRARSDHHILQSFLNIYFIIIVREVRRLLYFAPVFMFILKNFFSLSFVGVYHVKLRGI
jgi:hypothetical protein